MNTTDRIITALTPGSIFNGNGLVFRSVGSLAQFSGVDEEEVLGYLNGDLSGLVTCKPSTKGKGILVALTAVLQAQAEANPINVAAGPVGPKILDVQEVENQGDIVNEVPLPDAAADDGPAEEVVA